MNFKKKFGYVLSFFMAVTVLCAAIFMTGCLDPLHVLLHPQDGTESYELKTDGGCDRGLYLPTPK